MGFYLKNLTQNFSENDSEGTFNRLFSENKFWRIIDTVYKIYIIRSFFYRSDFKPDSTLSTSGNASLNNCAIQWRRFIFKWWSAELLRQRYFQLNYFYFILFDKVQNLLNGFRFNTIWAKSGNLNMTPFWPILSHYKLTSALMLSSAIVIRLILSSFRAKINFSVLYFRTWTRARTDLYQISIG